MCWRRPTRPSALCRCIKRAWMKPPPSRSGIAPHVAFPAFFLMWIQIFLNASEYFLQIPNTEDNLRTHAKPFMTLFSPCEANASRASLFSTAWIAPLKKRSVWPFSRIAFSIVNSTFQHLLLCYTVKKELN